MFDLQSLRSTELINDSDLYLFEKKGDVYSPQAYATKLIKL